MARERWWRWSGERREVGWKATTAVDKTAIRKRNTMEQATNDDDEPPTRRGRGVAVVIIVVVRVRVDDCSLIGLELYFEPY
jgi:hypothetical protein